MKTDKPFTENDYQEALRSLGIISNASSGMPEYAQLKKLYLVIESLEDMLDSNPEPDEPISTVA